MNEKKGWDLGEKLTRFRLIRRPMGLEPHTPIFSQKMFFFKKKTEHDQTTGQNVGLVEKTLVAK